MNNHPHPQATDVTDLLDRSEWLWLADQLEAWPVRRVHPDRTMSIGSLHRMAAVVIREATRSTQDAEIGRLRSSLSEIMGCALRAWPALAHQPSFIRGAQALAPNPTGEKCEFSGGETGCGQATCRACPNGYYSYGETQMPADEAKFMARETLREYFERRGMTADDVVRADYERSMREKTIPAIERHAKEQGRLARFIRLGLPRPTGEK